MSKVNSDKVLLGIKMAKSFPDIMSSYIDVFQNILNDTFRDQNGYKINIPYPKEEMINATLLLIDIDFRSKKIKLFTHSNSLFYPYQYVNSGYEINIMDSIEAPSIFDNFK